MVLSIPAKDMYLNASYGKLLANFDKVSVSNSTVGGDY